MHLPLRLSIVALLYAVLVLDAHAYPDKPIRMLLPYPPGAGSDVIARLLAQKLSDQLQQQVIVDNRGGAGGNIGMELAAKAAPDGYTVVFVLTSQLAINPALYPKLPYDPVKDYAPVTLVGSAPYVLVVHPSVQASSVRDLVALAKSRQGQLTFASAGNGSGAHLAAEMLKSGTGVQMIHVPYKGAGPALPDLISGQVNLMFATYSAIGQHVRSGRLRALGVTTARRSSALPDLPTIAEAGVAGYESSVWYGVLAPAQTQRAVVLRLNQELLRVLSTAETRERLAIEAIEPAGTTPEAFAAFIKAELAKWSKVVKESGARVD